MFQPQVVKRSIISETDLALLKIIAGKRLFPFRLVHAMRLIEYLLVSRNLIVAPNHFHQFDYLLWSIKTYEDCETFAYLFSPKHVLGCCENPTCLSENPLLTSWLASLRDSLPP